MSGKKYKKGFFIGRFQPFHHGHRYAIEYAHPQCEELIIGIGSPQESNTPTNPLDLKTRIEMIRAGLKDSSVDIGKIRFVAIPDFDNDDKWFSYINDMHPDIDAVFSGNDWVNSIFTVNGINVVEPPMHRRDELSGTNVRRLISRNEEWGHLVPPGAVGLIEKSKHKIVPAYKGRIKSMKKMTHKPSAN